MGRGPEEKERVCTNMHTIPASLLSRQLIWWHTIVLKSSLPHKFTDRLFLWHYQPSVFPRANKFELVFLLFFYEYTCIRTKKNLMTAPFSVCTFLRGIFGTPCIWCGYHFPSPSLCVCVCITHHTFPFFVIRHLQRSTKHFPILLSHLVSFHDRLFLNCTLKWEIVHLPTYVIYNMSIHYLTMFLIKKHG